MGKEKKRGKQMTTFFLFYLLVPGLDGRPERSAQSIHEPSTGNAHQPRRRSAKTGAGQPKIAN